MRNPERGGVLNERVSIFTGLDLDRTVLRSTTFFTQYAIRHIKLYYSGDHSEGVEDSIDELIAETIYAEQKNRGNAFDFVGYFNDAAAMRGHEGIDVYRLAEQIVDANRGKDEKILRGFIKDIIAEGALELIKALQEEEGGRWAFLTSGGEFTQTLKLAVVGIVIQDELGILARAQIISGESKAKDIVERWYDRSDDKFVVPPAMVDGLHVRVDSVRVIDDKTKNIDKGKERAHSERVRTMLVHPQEGRPHETFRGGLTILELTEDIRAGKN